MRFYDNFGSGSINNIMKTRVLFWTDSFPPNIGGVEVIAAQYLRSLIKKDYQFAIVTRFEGDEVMEKAEFEGMPVYRLNVRAALASDAPGPLLNLRRIVTEIAQEFQPDLLHIYHVGMGALLFDGMHQIPSLMTLHAHVPPEQIEPDAPLTTLLESIDYVACCSQNVSDELQESLPSFRGRSSAILNALEAPNIEPTPLSFTPPKILAIGRLVQAKGFDTAINAFALLHPYFPDLRMSIVGNGPAYNSLKRQISVKGLSEYIDMPGWVEPDDVFTLINEYTITIMPSRNREPFGLVALQTAQMARPIVASNIGGLPEVVEQDVTGLLVPQNDARAFALAVKSLLDDPERAIEMGLKARDYALSSFLWSNHIEAYDKLIQQMISQK
jgi:glycosyltransferase involved in cell wall biosynthesis